MLTERQMSKADDVNRIVRQIDETRQTEHFRNDDRPAGRAVRRRRTAQHPDVIRAQARLRVAAWRNRQDAAGAPTTAQIGQAMCVALVTSSLAELTFEDHGLVGRMLDDLQARGFSRDETLAVLARLRDRIVDPADSTGSGGPPAPALG